MPLSLIYSGYFCNANTQQKVWYVIGSWEIIDWLNVLFCSIKSKPSFYYNKRGHFKIKKILFGYIK